MPILSHENIETVLGTVTDTLRSALGNNLIALYTYGSVRTPAFDDNRSDIDCIAVTGCPLDDDEINHLRAALAEMAVTKTWRSKLQVSFLVNGRFLVPDAAACLYQFGKLSRTGSDGNPIMWLDHFERGTVLWGPDANALVPPISGPALSKALVRELGYLREELIENRESEWRHVTFYRAYAVLTLCRILYTAVTGKLASKPAAAKWASHGLLAQFSDLIRLALDSNHVKNPDRFHLNLLRDMIAVVEEHLSELSKP